MPNKLSALWEQPALRPLAPYVLSAWHDGFLTPSDLLRVRDALEKADWLSEDQCSDIHRWLDPQEPPPPSALQRLEREVQSWLKDIPASRRGSLSELAVALAEVPLGQARADAARGQLTPLDALLAYEPPPSEHARVVRAARGAQSDVVARLRTALDGEHKAMRDRVRELLGDPQFRFVSELSTQAYREQVLSWLKAIASSGLLEHAYPKGLTGERDAARFISAFETLSFFDLSLVVKFGVQFGLFGGTVEGLGTEKHKALVPDIASCELLGCFAMTERAHGSNVRDLGTVARYVPESQEFVITTPSLAAGKEWIGNAALHARMAVVFAQLETLGERHGVHAFLVPIRNAQGTLMRSVRIEDCGEKMGLNGVDNGRLWFDDVRVPREALLDRFGQVAEDGEYKSRIPSEAKRFFTMLGTLVGGRISVAGGALSASKVGLTIALRYAAHRRQFPDAQGVEQPLLQYLSHQRRLIPRLCAAYAFSFAQQELVAMSAALERDGDARTLERLAAGIKALGTWQALDTLQQCREACGGQGYLTSNRLDALRTDTDVFATFEGDNVVLLQLVAKELLAAFRSALKASPVRTVARALGERIVSAVADQNPFDVRRDDSESLMSFDFHRAAMRYREKSLLESLTRRIYARTARGTDAQAAFEACQDHALALARAHIESFVVESAQKAAAGDPLLARVCAVYGLWRVEADAAWFLENGYFVASKSRAIRKELNRQVGELADEAASLVDAFGIPASCLGPLADPEYLSATGLAVAAG
jgi:acyl-CoA oxidase